MDPSGYAEHSLPKIEYIQKHPSVTFALNDRQQYNEFRDEISLYFSGDCWAITINDEILYNAYEEKSVKAQIQDEIVRGKIIENPLILLRKAGRVIIYLFGDTPWFVAIHYENDIATVEYYKSTSYMIKEESLPNHLVTPPLQY